MNIKKYVKMEMMKMTDKDLKELYLNNLKDLKNISNFLNLTEKQREELNKHFQKIEEIIINSK